MNSVYLNSKYLTVYIIINLLSVNSDYDCILAMLLGSSRDGRLEVTQLSVPTTSETVSETGRVQSATRPG